jgi:hypothetical protein
MLNSKDSSSREILFYRTASTIVAMTKCRLPAARDSM